MLYATVYVGVDSVTGPVEVTITTLGRAVEGLVRTWELAVSQVSLSSMLIHRQDHIHIGKHFLGLPLLVYIMLSFIKQYSYTQKLTVF